MPKNPKKLTRADKMMLSKLSDEYRTAGEIRSGENHLEALASHGLAESLLETGQMKYRITAKGRSALASAPKKEMA